MRNIILKCDLNSFPFSSLLSQDMQMDNPPVDVQPATRKYPTRKHSQSASVQHTGKQPTESTSLDKTSTR